MKATRAECKINGLEVGSVEIKRGSDRRPVMIASYMLIYAPEDAQQPPLLHGKQQAVPNNWSLRTRELLDELFESMEMDLLSYHFNVGEKEEGEEDAPRLESGGLEETPQI